MHRHEGPPLRKFVPSVAVAVLLVLTGTGLLVGTYDDRPPWGTDIAYEGGYVLASRIRGYDVDGSRTKALLAGECARMERDGTGGDRAAIQAALGGRQSI
ncbi:hypothetical protein, partial [Streptomyces sp. NPDC006324]|uniref:hypothetical protein n=1 Tax=Streptomyces sp. NPDC006324 TaxID=3156751 RepID=UPI0033A014A5